MIEDCGPVVTQTWTMPPYRHRPGRTAMPEDGPAHEMASGAPQRLDADSWQTNEAYLFGFVLYRSGYFWEAHEVWEAVWKSCTPNSRERRLLQALIQMANAELKRELGLEAAAARIRDHAAGLLRNTLAPSAAAEPDTMLLGVCVAGLLRNIESDRN